MHSGDSDYLQKDHDYSNIYYSPSSNGCISMKKIAKDFKSAGMLHHKACLVYSAMKHMLHEHIR